MREEQVLAKPSSMALGFDIGRDSRQVAITREELRIEAQGEERGPGRDDRESDLLGDAIREGRGADLRHREPAGGNHERRGRERSAARLHAKDGAVAHHPAHLAGLAPIDAPLRALGDEHVDDPLRAVVAEELPERLLVIRDAVALHERDELARRVARQRRAAEIRVARDEVAVRGVDVGEVAAPAARNADLLADLRVVVDEHHAPPALPRSCGRHHSRGAGTDHGDVAVALLPERHQRRRAFAAECPRHRSFTCLSMISARRTTSRPGNSGSASARYSCPSTPPSFIGRTLSFPSLSSFTTTSSSSHAKPSPITSARIEVALLLTVQRSSTPLTSALRCVLVSRTKMRRWRFKSRYVSARFSWCSGCVGLATGTARSRMSALAVPLEGRSPIAMSTLPSASSSEVPDITVSKISRRVSGLSRANSASASSSSHVGKTCSTAMRISGCQSFAIAAAPRSSWAASSSSVRARR